MFALGLSSCADEQDTGSDSRASWGSRSVSVVAVPATRESLSETIAAVGTARALHSVVLYPETSGLVTHIYFSPDEHVDQNRVLLQLDDRDQRLAVRLADVELADAKRMVTRYTSVNRNNANIAESQIDTARAAVDAAHIALEQAELNVERRHIKAPFSGHVGITDIDVGDRIETTTPVTTLDDRSQLLVDFVIPEGFVGQIAPGTVVDVQLWNSDRPAFQGHVIAVDSRIDAASRAFTARAAIDNNDDYFRPGMAFEITVNVSRGSFIAVPDVAVQWGADGPYIWINKDGRAERREVQLVKRLPNRLMITGDVTEGTPVISEGVQAVRAGVALTVLSASAQSTVQDSANVPAAMSDTQNDRS